MGQKRKWGWVKEKRMGQNKSENGMGIKGKMEWLNDKWDRG